MNHHICRYQVDKNWSKQQQIRHTATDFGDVTLLICCCQVLPCSVKMECTCWGVGIINCIAVNGMDRMFCPRLFIIIYVWLISLANHFPTKKVLPKPQVSHRLHYIKSQRKKSYNKNKMAKKGQPDLSKFGFFQRPSTSGADQERRTKSLESILKYDKKKRKRDFLDKWQEEFPGLM